MDTATRSIKSYALSEDYASTSCCFSGIRVPEKTWRRRPRQRRARGTGGSRLKGGERRPEERRSGEAEAMGRTSNT